MWALILICREDIINAGNGKSGTNHKHDQDGMLLYPLHADSLGSNRKHAYIYTWK